MKNAKKVLSVLLAIIMIASVMPMAFAAEECEHSFLNFYSERPNLREDGYCYCSRCGVKSANFTEAIEVYSECLSIVYSIYGTEEGHWSAINVWEWLEFYVYGYDDYFGSKAGFLGHMTEKDQAIVDERMDAVKAVVNDFRANDFPVVYDADEMMYWGFWALFAHDYGKSIEMKNEVCPELFWDAFEYFEDICWRSEFVEVDAAVAEEYAEILTECYKIVTACKTGNHIFGEYTTNSDGSKTAECKYCFATDTIEADKDEDSFMKSIFDLIRLLIDFILSLFK